MISTKIEWADAVWNPIAGCSPASEGCRNCYAAKEAVRLASNPNERIRAKYAGTARMTGDGPNRRAVFTGRINIDDHALDLPCRTATPLRWFVNSMSDLFHPMVPDEWIDRVFAIMALSVPLKHVFLVLTKRPERAAAYLARPGMSERFAPVTGWPMRNLWLGTSCEHQAAWDARVPHLVRAPAVVRFVSCEPLLGAIHTHRTPWGDGSALDALTGEILHLPYHVFARPEPAPGRVHQVIIGGESGPHARPCNVSWIRSLVRQCEAAGAAAFVKQLGANIRDRNDVGFEGDLETYEDGSWVRPDSWPHTVQVEDVPGTMGWQGDPVRIRLRDRKGGDMEEWPSDLRVRAMPEETDA